MLPGRPRSGKKRICTVPANAGRHGGRRHTQRSVSARFLWRPGRRWTGRRVPGLRELSAPGDRGDGEPAVVVEVAHREGDPAPSRPGAA